MPSETFEGLSYVHISHILLGQLEGLFVAHSGLYESFVEVPDGLSEILALLDAVKDLCQLPQETGDFLPEDLKHPSQLFLGRHFAIMFFVHAVRPLADHFTFWQIMRGHPICSDQSLVTTF